MLYGHIENDEDRVDHLVRLRALQDQTNGFVTFIPLAYHPDNPALSHIPKTTGFDDLKNIAISRLMLDNIPHIKAYWIMMTPKVAQVALRFGSNDIDGTVVEEKIYHEAGATTAQSMRRGELPAADRSLLAVRAVERHYAVQAGAAHTENAFTVLVLSADRRLQIRDREGAALEDLPPNNLAARQYLYFFPDGQYSTTHRGIARATRNHPP